jgi:hypothetical protein
VAFSASSNLDKADSITTSTTFYYSFARRELIPTYTF